MVILMSDNDNNASGKVIMFLCSIQGVSCLLRWARGKANPRVDGIIAGAVSGLSMYFYRSSAVSLYVLIRLIDVSHMCQFIDIATDIWTTTLTMSSIDSKLRVIVILGIEETIC